MDIQDHEGLGISGSVVMTSQLAFIVIIYLQYTMKRNNVLPGPRHNLDNYNNVELGKKRLVQQDKIQFVTNDSRHQ